VDLQEFMSQSESKQWKDLSFADKAEIFNFWTIVYVLSDFLLIIGSLIILFIRGEAMENADVFIGFGCFFAWCSLPSFVHNTAQYSLITRTIAFSLPMVTRAMTGIIPVFIGFAFLGCCLFSDSNRYKNINFSLFTCFAAINGDSLYDIFYDISNFRFLAAIVYLMFFTFAGIV
jgi:hypothetical protein